MLALFDPTISFGSVLVAVTTVSAALGLLWKLARIEAKYEQQHNMMWDDYKKAHGINGGTSKKDTEMLREMFTEMMKQKKKEESSTE